MIRAARFCNFDNRWMFAVDVVPHVMEHSLLKEEYIPDKIVSEHRLVRIQLIVSKVIF